MFRAMELLQPWQSASYLMSSHHPHHRQRDLCMRFYSHESNSVSGTPAWWISSTLEAVFYTFDYQHLTPFSHQCSFKSALSNTCSYEPKLTSRFCQMFNEVCKWTNTRIVTLIDSINPVVFQFVVGSVIIHSGILFRWAKIWSSQVLFPSVSHSNIA